LTIIYFYLKMFKFFKFNNCYLLKTKSSNIFHKLSLFKLFSYKKPILTYIKNTKFSTNNSDTNRNPQHDEIMNVFNEDFEKTLSSNTEDVEKRVKLLSIKLLQSSKSKDVINIFEEKYIRGLVNNIYGEELTLFIYFYVSLIDKEYNMGDSSSYSIKGNKYLLK
jgi:hypothetical protein